MGAVLVEAGLAAARRAAARGGLALRLQGSLLDPNSPGPDESSVSIWRNGLRSGFDRLVLRRRRDGHRDHGRRNRRSRRICPGNEGHRRQQQEVQYAATARRAGQSGSTPRSNCCSSREKTSARSCLTTRAACATWQLVRDPTKPDLLAEILKPAAEPKAKPEPAAKPKEKAASLTSPKGYVCYKAADPDSDRRSPG